MPSFLTEDGMTGVKRGRVVVSCLIMEASLRMVAAPPQLRCNQQLCCG